MVHVRPAFCVNKFLNFVTLYFRYSRLLNGNKLRVHTDAMAQHFVQCQVCPENTQFFCKPCEVRLCEGCVGIHLQKKSPEAHQFIHYHKLWKNRKLMSEPEVVSIVTCPYTSMLDIARWGECNFYVCSTLSRHIHKFDFRKNEGVDNSLAPGWPRRLATFGDDIIFTERNENDVKILTKNGEFQTLFSTADWNARGIGCTASGHIILGLQKLNTGKVAIFDKAGRVLKEIVHNKQGSALYSNPYYVIESKNGDLCAADIVLAAVVVVDSDGGSSSPTPEIRQVTVDLIHTASLQTVCPIWSLLTGLLASYISLTKTDISCAILTFFPTRICPRVPRVYALIPRICYLSAVMIVTRLKL